MLRLMLVEYSPAFQQVLRGSWVAKALGEQPVNGMWHASAKGEDRSSAPCKWARWSLVRPDAVYEKVHCEGQFRID